MAYMALLNHKTCAVHLSSSFQTRLLQKMVRIGAPNYAHPCPTSHPSLHSIRCGNDVAKLINVDSHQLGETCRNSTGRPPLPKTEPHFENGN